MKVLESAHGSYPGRMVGISSNDMFLYGLTVRSTQDREANYSETPIPRISVGYRPERVHKSGSVHKLGIRRKTTVSRDPNTVYDALWASNDHNIVVISNGIHTGPLFGAYVHQLSSDFVDTFIEPMENVLYEFGPEPDRCKTPRIGLVVGLDGSKVFGIVRDDERPVVLENPSKHVSQKGSLILATYQPQSPDKNPVAPEGEHMGDLLIHAPVHGKTPAELAESLYEWMEPSLRVFAIAGGWSSHGLHLAVLDHRGLKKYKHALTNP